MEYRTLDPTRGRLIERFPFADDAKIERALADASAAQGAWSRRECDDRAALLIEMSRALDRRHEELASLMALEMGKPLAEGRAEVAKCAHACRYFAERAPGWLADDLSSGVPGVLVRREPAGLILAIMPWNFPLWQFFRFAAPALMAGNGIVLKHAPGTPRSALAIVSLAAEAGSPEGLIVNLFLSNDQAAGVIDDPRVSAVTFTGSTRAGRAVASLAGRAIKPVVLELGGSDPFIVLDDAEIERAAEVGVIARCQNAGQSCIAAKRFVVQQEVRDRFVTALVAGMQARVVGDPTENDVTIGPLARSDLREQLDAQVRATIGDGARLLCGGTPIDGDGFFYPPTVLADAPSTSVGVTEELFGPVAVVQTARDPEQALQLANATRYGLGASLWTTDAEQARFFVERLEAGSVVVNGMVRSDARLPFGGIKASGFGRELGRDGLLEFTHAKTIWSE